MFDDSSRWRLSEPQIVLIVAGVHAQWLVRELRRGRTSSDPYDRWVIYRTAIRAVLQPFAADGVQELSRRLIAIGDVPLANELLRLVYLAVNGKPGTSRA